MVGALLGVIALGAAWGLSVFLQRYTDLNTDLNGVVFLLPGVTFGLVIAGYTRLRYCILSLLAFSALWPAALTSGLFLAVNTQLLLFSGVIVGSLSSCVALLYCHAIVAPLRWRLAVLVIALGGISGYMFTTGLTSLGRNSWGNGNPDLENQLLLLFAMLLWQSSIAGLVAAACCEQRMLRRSLADDAPED